METTNYYADKSNRQFLNGKNKFSKNTSQDNVAKNIDAPLAFQSAMAGILLAAELVRQDVPIELGSIKQGVQIFPLFPISRTNPHPLNMRKNKTGRCICADSIFLVRYKEKWTPTAV